MKKSQVKFSPKSLERKIFKSLAEEQTRRLIAYAKDIIKQIGDAINNYHSKNHMDRNGNLLDSLCWGVSYRGELKGYGFYREKRAKTDSYLHEWTRRHSADKDPEFWSETSEMYPVNGRELAQNYIDKYGDAMSNGWRIFFAVLAPYWGYWEDGFNMRRGGVNLGFKKFAVMTWFYDTVNKDLKPTNIRFKVNVETYSHSYRLGKTYIKGSIQKDYEAYANYATDRRKRRRK